MKDRLGSPMYNSMWQPRRDTWSNLEEAAADLDGADRVRQVLAVLEPMEQYWGFPGRRRFAEVQGLLTGGDLGRFASLDTPEVHGYRADLGYRVLTEAALAGTTPAETAASAGTAAPPAQSRRRDSRSNAQASPTGPR